MVDYQEEQELELEALESIYLEDFTRLAGNLITVAITVKPYENHSAASSDSKEVDLTNLCLALSFQFGETYPDVGPVISVVDKTEKVGEEVNEQQHHALQTIDSALVEEVVKYLNDEEVEKNIGMPMVFSLMEAARDYLAKDEIVQRVTTIIEDKEIEKGDDGSMYAQMLIKNREKERQRQVELSNEAGQDAANSGEQTGSKSQRQSDNLTPVTKESFMVWREKFQKEMKQKRIDTGELVEGKEEEDEESRLSGKGFFLSHREQGVKDVEEGEAALQNLTLDDALQEPEGISSDGGVEVDEDLFLQDDDEDLDIDDFSD